MLAEIGHFALILCFGLSFLLMSLPAVGVYLGRPWLSHLTLPLVSALFLFSLLSFIFLIIVFLQDDFSVRYVANNSNSLLPWYYKLSATWGAHEGSMLLWILVLTGWMFAVAWRTRQLPVDFMAIVLAVMSVIAFGFIAFVLFTSDPFERLLPFPRQEGNDLNPLLQDFGLIVHPPLLYMGYVGLSVAFGFSMAALISQRLDTEWIRVLRPWTNVAWAFLTIGIVLGSWWAYYELGWGGWWFWDPVENASLMPWLIGTALIHSQAVAEKRGTFKRWMLLLAICAFSLSLLGTFLVRSGVLTSVHAFAADPERGMFILCFLCFVVGSSLLVYAFKAQDIESATDFSLLSRDTSLLWNNIFFVLMTLIVLLGTLYPLIIDFLGIGSVSVGPPYFNLFFVIFMIPVLLLLAPGSVSRWGKTDLAWLVERIRWPLITSVVLGLLIPFLFENYSIAIAVAAILAFWIVTTTLDDVRRRWNYQRQQPGTAVLGCGYWGMVMAHIGVAVMTVGIVFTSVLSENRDVRLAVGEAVTFSGYSFEVKEYRTINGPNYVAVQGDIVISSEGRQVAELFPQKRRYLARGDVMTEAGIDGTIFRDLYVSMGEEVTGGAWAVRLHVKPFIRWVWWGGVLIALGAVLAVLDRRYRKQKENPIGLEVTA